MSIGIGDQVRIVAEKPVYPGRTGRITSVSYRAQDPIDVTVYFGDGEYETFPSSLIEQIAPCPPVKIDRLNEWSQSVFEELARRKPEWLAHALNSVDNTGSLDIVLEAPHTRNNPMIISTTGRRDISVFFEPDHFHIHQIGYGADRGLSEQVDGLLAYLEAIFDEHIVAISIKLLLGRGAGGSVDLFELYRLIENGKISRARSWKGSFNYEASDGRVPIPPDRILTFHADDPPIAKCGHCKHITILDRGQFMQSRYLCSKCQHEGNFEIPRPAA